MKINDMSFVLDLDRFPPSVNHAYYHIKKGKAFIKVKTKECKEFIDYVHSQFPETYSEIQNDGKTYKEIKVEPFKEPVQMNLIITMGDKRKRDIDNMLKILIDSLIGKAFVDDSQIQYLTIRKVMGTAHHLNIRVIKLVRPEIKKKICPICNGEFNEDALVLDIKTNQYICSGCW